ncbi:MAG: site-specific integrase [Desulfobacteraceae bacterium]|nr:site-specific integrase [Desulfobacteraceae bacterium]
MACIAKRRERYVIDFYDTYGKRRWITMPKGTTKKKAMEKLREIEDQLRRGIYLPDKKIPNFKQVAKDWIEHKKPNLRHSTWSVYEGHTRNHFDDFNPIKINRITTAKVEKWISTRHNEGMNLATMKKILISMGQIMAYAVRHGYIDYNPIREAERPRGNGEIEGSKIRVLIPAEINAFLDTESDMRYRTLFMLAIFSGARQGENIKYIQTQLGHASPSITMDVYAHLMNSTNQVAASRLENTVLNFS